MKPTVTDLTPSGLDRLAKHPKWGEVRTPNIPQDIIMAANNGEYIREPTDDEIKSVDRGVRANWSRKAIAIARRDGRL